MKLTVKTSLFWLAAFVVAGLAYWSWNHTPFGQELSQTLTPENIKHWIEGFGFWGPAVFIIFYTLVSLTLFSTTVITILSGVLFGKFWGTAYVIIAATIGAQLAFMISRALGGNKAEKLKTVKGIGKIMTELDRRLEKDGFKNFLILRCLFLPYIGLSYAAGLVPKAKNRDFILATLVTNAIFSPAFVFFGDSLMQGPQALVLPVIMIVLVLLVPKVVKRFQKHD